MSGRATVRMIGEGAVIVASILLAFALDAWWDTQRDAAEAAQLTEALIVEFDEAMTELDRVEGRNLEVVAAADSLIYLARTGATAIRIDAMILAALILTPTTDPPKGTLDAVLASGDLGLLPSRALQSRLADWPASLSDAQEEELAARDFVLGRLIPFLERETSIRPIYEARLSGATVHRGEVASAATESGSLVSLELSDELVRLVETRRYLSRFILSNHQALRRGFEEIRADLASAK